MAPQQLRPSMLRAAVAAACAVVGTSAADAAKDLDLVLYGATGCVGGFAAKHLAQQKGLRWAVAGRNASEVGALASELCSAEDTVSCPEQIVAPLDATHDPAEWVRRTRAVATAAGPFSAHHGERLVEACAKLGVHYVDTSDEFYWQREMIDRYDAVARASGARVVLAGGFCALAGDLGAQLALSAAGAAPGHAAQPAHVDSWLEVYNGGVSAGVLNTFKAIKNASFPKEWETDPYVLAPGAEQDLKVDTSVTGLGSVGWDWHEGPVTQNVFGPYDARLLRRSFASLGQAVHYRAGAPPSMYTKWTGFLAVHPGSWTSLTKCPTPSVYQDGSWQMRVRAAPTASAAGAAVVLSGSGDPGYRFTSHSLAEVGLCLAGKTAGCLRAEGSGGVLTSMGALEPQAVRERLEAVGLLRVQQPSSDASAILVV